jgi:hypothetical protein
VTIANTLFWGNARGGEVDELAQLRIGDGTLSIDYSSLQGWTGAYGGIANNDHDPLFVDELGPDGLPGTGDENYDLQSGLLLHRLGRQRLPAARHLRCGCGWRYSGVLPRDLAGGRRVIDDPCTADTGSGEWPFVDRGAYEMPPTDHNGEPTWSALGDGTDGYVHAMATFDDGSGDGAALYVGGRFTTAGGIEANCIARWDGVSWSAVWEGRR